jgi:signal recognition particle subunit SRP54
MMKDVEIDNDAFKPIVSMIQSMTPSERANPDMIVGNRRKRIALGSGRNIQDVNNLMKQFEEMRKMMKKMSHMQGKIPNFMR